MVGTPMGRQCPSLVPKKDALVLVSFDLITLNPTGDNNHFEIAPFVSFSPLFLLITLFIIYLWILYGYIQTAFSLT
jgi:hypothetical protein